ncbi:hypothetical protein P9250_14255 [Caballeronia sp. LP006]|uniref:hypothetical protein n=1 Tax=Caballeronia sp. LP006 TaxID=3038552 RepID=UPI00285BA3D3|nr:hypothetical protein [Caballeronia sp. LP006]MDR5829045.1 hypothetical protein [Caballeronia sp. LP006]
MGSLFLVSAFDRPARHCRGESLCGVRAQVYTTIRGKARKDDCDFPNAARDKGGIHLYDSSRRGLSPKPSRGLRHLHVSRRGHGLGNFPYRTRRRGFIDKVSLVHHWSFV